MSASLSSAAPAAASAPGSRAGADPSAARALETLFLRRRATPRFRPDPIPVEVIDQALRLAAEAPSGYNFQPWRFLVLRSPEGRARLREAAFDQSKITEAPVVIVATADREAWRDDVETILREQAVRTGRDLGDPAKLEKLKANALGFIDGLPREVWLTRQVMIAFTYLMLAFESLGWDTAPMEGFDAAEVREKLRLPASTEVVALLAAGRALDDKPHPGRLPVGRIAYDERHGAPWRES